MPDMETVITHLQIIHTWAEFARERDLQFFTLNHLEKIAEWTDDALELLKEQEPVEPKRIDGKRNYFIKCGNCNYDLVTGFQFCPHCGQAVKWE